MGFRKSGVSGDYDMVDTRFNATTSAMGRHIRGQIAELESEVIAVPRDVEMPSEPDTRFNATTAAMGRHIRGQIAGLESEVITVPSDVEMPSKPPNLDWVEIPSPSCLWIDEVSSFYNLHTYTQSIDICSYDLESLGKLSVMGSSSKSSFEVAQVSRQSPT